ncbi:MAG: hypothetical protein L0Y74_04745, partial [candidate division Zixibacteria bacterium]|nr:hypothetical protein [candidate division Zixibacteria bacterium]
NNRVCIFPASTETPHNGSIGRALQPPTWDFNKPTAVAYGYDKATGKHKNELFVVSQGNGDIYWLQFNTNALYVDELLVQKTVKLDFDWLVFTGQALPNYFLSSATVDNHNMLWVLDQNNGMVYKFWPKESGGQPDTLILVGSWGGLGTADGQLNYPNAMAAQHGVRIENCGNNCFITHYLTNLHDILITETWGPETGIRRFSMGVEAFTDSSKYIAKSDSGGNFVDFWYSFTDYVNLTENVYRVRDGALIESSTVNQERAPKGSIGGRWPVGTNDSGTYRIEIIANSLYGDASDVKNFTVFVDTSLRNNAPVVTQNPYYVHPEWSCFFPPDAGIGLGPLNYGGDFVKVVASDPDADQLTYTWKVDTTLGWVGPDSRHVEYSPPGTISSHSTSADSVFYAVPTSYRNAFQQGALAPSTNCTQVQCLELQVIDPAGNWIEKPGVGLKNACQRGDLDASGKFSATDVVLLLLVVFSDIAPEPYGDYKAMTDMNCDGQVSPADAVIHLNMVFTGAVPPC